MRSSKRFAMHIGFVRELATVLHSAVIVALVFLSPSIQAGPLVLEEKARLTSPDPSYVLNGPVAAWGNDVAGNAIIATATKSVPGPVGMPPVRVHAAFLFERQRGSEIWSFTRKLVEQADENHSGVPITVAMNDGIAAINLPTPGGSSLHVFEAEGIVGSPLQWLPKPVTGSVETADLEVRGGTIIAGTGTCTWDARLFQRDNGATGTWVVAGNVTGPFRGCNHGNLGGDVDTFNYLIAGYPFSEDSPPQSRIYSGPAFPGDAMFLQGTFLNPEEPGMQAANSVAIWGATALASATPTGGSSVFELNAAGWHYNQALRPVDAFVAGLPAYIDMEESIILQQHNQANGAVAVFQEIPRGFSHDYLYVAKLVPSAGSLSSGSADLGHQMVVVQGDGGPYVYDLPEDFTQPPLRQDDFQDGNSVGWNPQAGSSFSVVNGPDSRVYRQQSLAGNATSLLNDSVMQNQSIQADVKPIAFQGADRWLGLAVRYADAGNYYYVTLRSSNVVQLRRIVNGVFSTLASAPLTVTPGRTYSVRLEAIGGTIRVYINGVATLHARDSTLAQGSAGLIMYRASADYDNVIVSPNPRTAVLADNFETNAAAWWVPRGVGQWSVVTDAGSRVYAQSSVAGGAQSWTGVPTTDDQIIETRAKATAFGAGAGRWFGVLARQQNDSNYYYLTLRNDNTVSLRRLINGSIHVLDTAPLTVTTGSWYALRLEAVGDALRGYVNGRLLLEARDSTFARGTYGLVMYKAATRYDDFKAVQP